MQFTISDGTQKEIIEGSRVKLVPGFLPGWYDEIELVITKIESGYPFAVFHHEETVVGIDNVSRTEVLQHEESAISPEIIKEVL